MQQSTSTTSEPEAEGSGDPFVLDFLYHDSRRIGSFLSQFEGDGHLQSLTRTKAGSRGKEETTRREGKGTLAFASGSLEGKKETSVSMNEGYSRVFDPYWSNARAFLNFLNEADLLQRDIHSADIGQFVMSKGWLSVLDLSILQEAWKKPAIQKKVFAGNAPAKPASQMTRAEKEAARDSRENTELLLDMMQILPHSIHAQLLVNDEPSALVWGTLRDEYMVTPAADLTLTHGKRLAGEWSVVGILTAQPDFAVPDFETVDDDTEIGMMESVIGKLSAQLAPIARFSLGRPAAAHAVTPLLIFREVA